MKKILLFLLLFFISAPSVYARADIYTGGNCSSFYGEISSQNWPVGQPITISCEGDTGPYCSGDQRTYTLQSGLNTEYTLNNCSCGVFVPTGIIKIVSPLPAGCAMATDLSQYQALNGWKKGADFGIGCEAPPATPTPTPLPPNKTCEEWYCDAPKTCDNGNRYQMARKCTQGSVVTYEVKCETSANACALPTPTPRPTNTPTPSPTPPQSCPAPAQVPNVRVSCPYCN